MTLNEIKINSSCRVVRVNGSGAIRRRIMDMGVTKGCVIYVKKKAPLGDPIEITLRGYELTIRKLDAALIEVCDEGSACRQS